MKRIDYYLMRHASYYGHEDQYVTYRGALALKQSVDKLKIELEKDFPQKSLRIIHSILPRAKHTSLLMQEMLGGFKALRTSDPRLNSDKLQINDAYIAQTVRSCEKDNEVCLILSHQPDIEYFCKKDLATSEFIRMTVGLDVESPASSTATDDDLPF